MLTTGAFVGQFRKAYLKMDSPESINAHLPLVRLHLLPHPLLAGDDL